MKKSLLLIGLLGLTIVVIVLVFLLRQHDRDLEEIQNDGRITVLIDSGEHGFTRDSAKVAGFQYEIIKRYADKLGVELVILQEPDHERGTKELVTGNCDVIVSLQPLLTDSGATVVSLLPLVETNLMLVQLPDSLGKLPVKKQYLLDQKEISLTKASPYQSVLTHLSDDLAIDMQFTETNYLNLNDLIQAVAAGEIAYTVCPEYLVQRMKSRYPQVDMSVPLTFHLQLAWTVRNTSPLLRESLNQFIADFTGSAEYWTLYATYFTKKR